MNETMTGPARRWTAALRTLRGDRLEHRLLIGIARQTRDSALSSAVLATIIAILFSYSGSPIRIAEPQVAWFWCGAVIAWSLLALWTGRQCLADRGLRRRVRAWRYGLTALFVLHACLWPAVSLIDDWHANPTGEVFVVLIMIGLLMAYLVDLSRHLLVMTAAALVAAMFMTVSLQLYESELTWLLRTLFPLFLIYVLFQGGRNHRRIAAGVRRQMALTALANRLAQANSREMRESRKKTAFFAAMSHELRTPLNAIIGFADAIDSEVFGPVQPPRYRDYVRNIHGSGAQMLALVDRLLIVADTEDDSPAAAVEPVASGALLEDIRDTIGREARRTDTALHLDDRAACMLELDRRQFRRALGTLAGVVVADNDGREALDVRLAIEHDNSFAVIIHSGGRVLKDLWLDRALDLREPDLDLGGDWTADERFGSQLDLYAANRLIRSLGGTVKAEQALDGGVVLRILLPGVLPPASGAGRALAS